MLTLSNSGSRLGDRICRRGFLTAGALGIGGLTLADLRQLRAQGAVRARSVKSIIRLYLHGGPSHIDTFDMRPDAPAEFRPIRTRVKMGRGPAPPMSLLDNRDKITELV
jgi:hypothetical protein